MTTLMKMSALMKKLRYKSFVVATFVSSVLLLALVLAGSAAISGAVKLSELLREIETGAKLGEAEKLRAKLGELPEVAQLTIEVLLERVSPAIEA